MKILAIRGKNLASLAGEFEVDFQREPLASSGLFAISGPTGAGKSTLLDALCLALYDSTPRLIKAAAKGILLPDGNNKPVTPGNTGNLLRRGCSEGMAEVDFVGNDQAHYRATWSIRRAGNKATGSLQKTVMSLKTLPGLLAIGGTNSEVKAAIAERLGLAFEQFTRACLLAQNEFFAFLKADENERGELLETLTGSSIYSELSKAAFEREKQERAKLQQLQARLQEQNPLTDEERSTLESAITTSLNSIRAKEAEQQGWQQAWQWREQLDRLRASEQQAFEHWQSSQAQQQAVQAARDYLAKVQSVQAARPLMQEWERIAHALPGMEQQMRDLDQQAQQAQVQQQATLQAQMAASTGLQRAEQARLAAASGLDQAKALDAHITGLQPALAELRQQVQQARHGVAESATALNRKQQERLAVEQAQQTSQTWLDAHQSMADLARDWPRWDTLLAAASEASEQHAQHLAQLQPLQAQLPELEEAHSAAQTRLDQARARLAQLDHIRQTALTHLATFDGDALRLALQQAQAQREQVAEALTLWQQLHQHTAQEQALAQQIAESARTLQHAEAKLADLARQEPILSAQLAQAEQALKRVETACAQSVNDLRAQLQNEQPCPVCGSSTHPYADSAASAQLHQAMQALAADLHRLRQDQQSLLQARARQQTLAEQAKAQAISLRPQHDHAKRLLHATDTAWHAHALVQTWLAHAPNGHGPTEIEAMLDSAKRNAQAAWQTTSEQEQCWRDALRDKDVAQQSWEQAASDLNDIQRLAQHSSETLTQARNQHQRMAERCAEDEKRCNQILDQLDPVCATYHRVAMDAAMDAGTEHWRHQWRRDERAFHARYRADVLRWQEEQRGFDERQRQLQQLQLECSNCQRIHDDASTAARQIEERLAAQEQHWHRQQAARQQLFDGVAVKWVESRLQQAIDLAKTDLARHSEALQAGELALQAKQQEARTARIQYAAQQEALEQAAHKLTQWLDTINTARHQTADLFAMPPLDDKALRQLLGHEQAWIERERQQIEAVDQAVFSSHTVWRERQQQANQHEARKASLIAELAAHPCDASSLQAMLSTLAEQRQRLQSQLGAQQLQWAQDQAKRTQAAAILSQITSQTEAHRVWDQLSSLIGSADGKKFRNVAQQLTLDVLLGYANVHLTHLARRYRLERLKDTLALMVIDQDMGDEARSVHSLSGGESFLVSLALALGLASLSSNRVKVESLFIDEGFGSLDLDTLRVAMDALDGLQSMGRKVGVISHVQEMTERIAVRILVERGAGGKSSVRVEAG